MRGGPHAHAFCLDFLPPRTRRVRLGLRYAAAARGFACGVYVCGCTKAPPPTKRGGRFVQFVQYTRPEVHECLATYTPPPLYRWYWEWDLSESSCTFASSREYEGGDEGEGRREATPSWNGRAEYVHGGQAVMADATIDAPGFRRAGRSFRAASEMCSPAQCGTYCLSLWARINTPRALAITARTLSPAAPPA